MLDAYTYIMNKNSPNPKTRVKKSNITLKMICKWSIRNSSHRQKNEVLKEWRHIQSEQPESLTNIANSQEDKKKKGKSIIVALHFCSGEQEKKKIFKTDFDFLPTLNARNSLYMKILSSVYRRHRNLGAGILRETPHVERLTL